MQNLSVKIKTAIAAVGFGVPLAFAPVAIAATTTVNPSSLDGWSTADTRPGGTVNFVNDPTSPYGSGALQLKTDSTNAAKAQFLNGDEAGTALSDVTELSYYTKQNSASFSAGLPSFQLAIDTDGTIGDGLGFTTLVYEPYNNFGNAAVQNNTWQQWDVDAGTFWSSRSVGGLTAGAGGPPFYSIQQVLALNPNAVVVAFGVNIGTFNPIYDVETDGVVFNGTVYDFEASPSKKDDCKNDGWKLFSNPSFKNQGACVSYVASAGKTSNPHVSF